MTASLYIFLFFLHLPFERSKKQKRKGEPNGLLRSEWGPHLKRWLPPSQKRTVSIHVILSNSLRSLYFYSSKGKWVPKTGRGTLNWRLPDSYLGYDWKLYLLKNCAHSFVCGQSRAPPAGHPVGKYSFWMMSTEDNTLNPDKPLCHGILNSHH